MQISLKKFLITGLALSLILSMNTVYYDEIDSSVPKYLILSGVISFSIVLTLVSIYHIIQTGTKLKGLLIFYLAYTLLSVLLMYFSTLNGGFGGKNLITLIIFPLLIAPSVYWGKANHSIAFFKSYESLVILLSYLSLAGWLLAMIGVSTNMTRQISWGTDYSVNGYFNLHFLSQNSVSFLGLSVIRNTGLFVEAPMYSFVLSVALLSHLFITKTDKWADFNLLILGVTILTTTSTTGVLVLVLAVFLRLALSLNGLKKFLLIGLAPVALFVVALVIQAKMQSMSGSVNIRLNDFYVGFQAWKERPFFGHSILDTSSIKNYMDVERTIIGGNDGFSSGFMEMLVAGGGFFACFWGIVPFWKYGLQSVKNAMFACLLFVLLLVTIIDKTFLFMYLLVFMVL